jgi:hypothetical protein
MCNHTSSIQITSLRKLVRVNICNGKKEIRREYFKDIPSAIRFVLPHGTRRTDLRLNGHPFTLAGWWA